MVDKILWEILVPTCQNDGKPFDRECHLEWDKQVRLIAGGLTILTPTKGQWLSSDGKLFHEKMIPVRISCSEEQIHQIADMSAKHYLQNAIMFYCISTKVFIKNYV